MSFILDSTDGRYHGTEQVKQKRKEDDCTHLTVWLQNNFYFARSLQ